MSDALTKLSRVLGMMGSEHDGEVLNAARVAERMRRDMNKSWAVLLSGSSGSGNNTELLLRALRAEDKLIRTEVRAAQAEQRATALEKRVALLERTISDMQQSRPSPTGSSSTTSGASRWDKFKLTPEVERELVKAMTDAWCSITKIYRITNWPRAHLRVQLELIARRNWSKLEYRKAIYGHGYIYRFVAL